MNNGTDTDVGGGGRLFLRWRWKGTKSPFSEVSAILRNESITGEGFDKGNSEIEMMESRRGRRRNCLSVDCRNDDTGGVIIRIRIMTRGIQLTRGPKVRVGPDWRIG